MNKYLVRKVGSTGKRTNEKMRTAKKPYEMVDAVRTGKFGDVEAIFLLTEKDENTSRMKQILAVGDVLFALNEGGDVFRYDGELVSWVPLDTDIIAERIL